MTRKSIKGTISYSRLTLFVNALLLFSAFLPWISVSTADGHISLSYIQLITKAFVLLSNKGITIGIIYSIILLTLPIMIILAAIANVLKLKFANTLSAIASAITAACSALMLISAKKLVDAAGFMHEPFLVRYLGIGFWMFIVLAFTGLIFSMKAKKISSGYIILILMSIIWLFPIVWIILISFRGEGGFYTPYFIPKTFTFNNYFRLLTENNTFYFSRWFANTLFVAVCSSILSTFIILSTAYIISKIRFHGRKALMNLLLIMGMFPGFMSMIAVYYIVKGLGLSQSITALIIVYASGSALGYYVVKGFFDTIPRAIEDAAYIDGATKWQVFTRITIPLSKPIIIYTILTSFIAPWADFIFARVILGDNYKNYTVAVGLYTMLENTFLETWYTRFAAGAVLVSIPISILFIMLQKYYVDGISGSVKG